MKRLSILVLILCATALWAGNSIFSYDGFPVQYYGRDIYSLGMGDAGASDVFRYNTGYANPAMHNKGNQTLFSTGILLGYNIYDSEYQGQKQNFWDDAVDFPYFSVSVPVGRHRFGAQFNSHSSGVVKNMRTLANGSVERQVADKYMYRADLIYSINVASINAGISGNFYFGHDNRSFAQTGNYGSFDTVETVMRDFKNPGVTVGFLKSYNKFSLGAHYSPGITLKGESERRSIHETEATLPYEYKLADSYCLSTTVLPFNEMKLAADITYESYSSIYDNYRDGMKAGFGIAYEPIPEHHKGFLLKFPVRCGASMRQLPFPDSNGKDINETGLSFGLTFPLKNEVNRIDLGFQYLKRGSLAKNNLSDTSLMMMIGLTGFDIITKTKDKTAPRDIPQKEVMD